MKFMMSERNTPKMYTATYSTKFMQDKTKPRTIRRTITEMMTDIFFRNKKTE
jgi:uncharacterized protein (UPF0147 family)